MLGNRSPPVSKQEPCFASVFFGYILENAFLTKQYESLLDFVNLMIRLVFGDTLAVAEKKIAS